MSAECSLTWRAFSQHLEWMLRDLYEEESHSDITLICEGQVQFRAHRIVLSACSPVFREIIDSNPSQHPLIYLRGIQAQDMKAVLQFMYLGEGRFYQERMGEFLKVAKDLEVKDINIGTTSNTENNETKTDKEPATVSMKSLDDEVTSKSEQILVTEDRRQKLDIDEKIEVEDEPDDEGGDQCEYKNRETEEGESKEIVVTEGSQERLDTDENIEVEADPDDEGDDQREYVKGGTKEEEDEEDNDKLEETEDEIKDEHATTGIIRKVNSGEVIEGKEENHGTRLKDIKNLSIDPDYPVCPECGVLFSQRSSVIVHYKAFHLGITYQCDQCELVTKHRGTLKKHIQVKHGNIKYPCHQCDYQSKDDVCLKRHIARWHENITYPCVQCDHKARSNESLKNHIKAKHECVKYYCDECGKNFSHKASLDVHINSIHRGLKFTCEECGHGSTQISNLKTHMKIKHNK